MTIEASLRTRDAIIVIADLTGYARAFDERSDEAMARLIDRYYAAAHDAVTKAGGTVIKFMGDACLAVFPVDGAGAAAEAMLTLREQVIALARERSLAIDLGANLHAGSVVEGEFGGAASSRRDIIGRAVNHTFLMGSGIGLRASEAFLLQLPAAARASWRSSGNVFVLEP